MLGTPTEGWEGGQGDWYPEKSHWAHACFLFCAMKTEWDLSDSLEALSVFEAGNYKPHIVIMIFLVPVPQ